MNQEQLKEILEKHKLWIQNKEGGERADLRDADLQDADLRDADLQGANLWHAGLQGANLRNANLRGADLRNADLRDADLRDADLRNADLQNTVGNIKHLKSGRIEEYPFAYTSTHLQIGHEKHPIEDWWDFSDNRILEMDGPKALAFWKKWKDWFRMTIEMSPAEPTR